MIKQYIKLIENFLNNKISGRKFETKYLNLWRYNRDTKYPLNERVSIIVDKLFTDVDCYTDNEELIAKDPIFNIDENELRRCAKIAYDQLLEIYKEEDKKSKNHNKRKVYDWVMKFWNRK